MTLTVVATFVARPGREAEAEHALSALVAPTRAEEGCFEYVLHRGDEDRRQFLFFERWRSREDLERHLATAHIERLRSQVEELFERGPDLSFWRGVDGARGRSLLER